MRRSLLYIGAAALGLISSANAASQYSIQVLDSIHDTTDVYATGINNAGQAVGHTVDLDGKSHAVLWDADGVHELPYISTNTSSEAYRINNAGQIVGKAQAADGQNHATLWSPSTGSLVPTSAQDIGVLAGGNFSFAMDINENGVVAGSSKALHGQHAFTWTQAGGMVDNGSQNPIANGAIAGWNGINSSGKLVGTSYIIFSPYKASRGQLGDAQPTQMSPAGQFSNGMALAVSDAGTMVGWQSAASGGSPQAAIFNGDGTFQGLGHLGLGESWAEDVNESGLIVGRAFGDPDGNGFIQKSFVWENGVMTDLSTVLTNGDGWTTLFSASGVNDLGQIVGAGMYNGVITAYVLTPVPEPATIGAVTCALGALAMRRRRQSAG
jgi:probable HAF family extracellular repeat protein